MVRKIYLACCGAQEFRNRGVFAVTLTDCVYRICCDIRRRIHPPNEVQLRPLEQNVRPGEKLP
eukprot:scaffold97746_cov39-Prasinocladus_malaysianus.AAC.1